MAENKKKRLLEICHTIMWLKEEKLISKTVHFAAKGRTRPMLDEKIVSAMSKAGFYYLFLGFESGSDRLLKEFDKNASLKENVEALDLCNKYGIKISVNFILMPPHTKVLDVIQTLKLAAYVERTGDLRKIDNASYFIMGELPSKIPLCSQALDTLSEELLRFKEPKDPLCKRIFPDMIDMYISKPDLQSHKDEHTRCLLMFAGYIIKTLEKEKNGSYGKEMEMAKDIHRMLNTPDIEELKSLLYKDTDVQL